MRQGAVLAAESSYFEPEGSLTAAIASARETVLGPAMIEINPTGASASGG